MRKLLLFCSIMVAVTVLGQTSGGQIKRLGTNKEKEQKPSVKKTRIKKQLKRSSTSSVAEPVFEVLEIIPIESATEGGRDVTDWARKSDLQTILYTVDGNLFMANYTEKDETKSWGPLSITNQSEQVETSTQYGALTLECIWDYYNDYDEKSGKVPVIIEMIDRGDGIYYIITIKAKELILYQGFVSNVDENDKTSPSKNIIQPILMRDLFKYNVVCASFSMLENASIFCSKLRNSGYNAQIFYDSRKMYRVIINRYHSEQEALNFRNSIKTAYPDAWILLVNNGKEERYLK